MSLYAIFRCDFLLQPIFILFYQQQQKCTESLRWSVVMLAFTGAHNRQGHFAYKNDFKYPLDIGYLRS